MAELDRSKETLLLEPGRPEPLGASLRDGGVNFAVFSRHATSVTLELYRRGASRPFFERPLDPEHNRTGEIWHARVRGDLAAAEYVWRADGPHAADDPRHRFDPADALIDPYARAIAGAEAWGRGGARRPLRALVAVDAFDWEGDRPPARHPADSVIYELHVRGFTRHPSSGAEFPGTYRGLIEKIPYLENLGVTAVELMPVFEFDELDNERSDPLTGEPLLNYWGYQPLAFFAPKAGYAADRRAGGAVREFKRMVRALHRAGIEVILDVVFNHTGEGGMPGRNVSFRGLDNAVYYMLDDEGGYRDYSGCGNTLNCNHPVVRDLILDALRYWVAEMHVDGFRFDLASILGRGQDGEPLADSPLLERIAEDPLLADTKLIAEAWDAAGLYQLGGFCERGRWAEWNGKFRDDLRRFVRGDAGMTGALATRLAGSADLFRAGGRAPFHSINFVTSHDGLTLRDLVSYDRRHNLANDEDNRDGHPETLSWNCGHEGPTDDPVIEMLRRRQMKNFAALLLTAQGVPMILAGDELSRSQRGNNNAWCQDNELSWLDWDAVVAESDMLRFFRLMIEFRQRHAALRRRAFFDDGDGEVVWHGTRAGEPDWSEGSHLLGMQLVGEAGEPSIHLIANAGPDEVRCELPPPNGGGWHRFVDTSLDPPHEIRELSELERLGDGERYDVAPRSTVILVSG